MSVVLPNSHSPLFLNPNEQRSRRVLLCHAKGQPRLKSIWHCAITTLKPLIVLDVGANYGEFTFAERYPDSKRVIAIEANTELKPWLLQSWEHHPEKEKITLEFAIAAESSGESRSFFINSYSSGRSSAVKRQTDTWAEQQSSTVALDDLVVDIDLQEAAVVFKIDVEGYEAQVMSGMCRLLSLPKYVLGLIEFNSLFIQHAGKDPEEFLQFLARYFSIVALPHGSSYVRLDNASLSQLRELTGNHDVELDLVLLSHMDLLPILDDSPNN